MNSWPENFERENELYKQAQSFLVWKPVFCPSNMKWCIMKCARRDWSERVHYISIKHAPYVTRVHCWDIMHATYVIRTSARKHSRSARSAVRASPHVIGPENSRYVLCQSGAKLKPIACWPLVFFHDSVCCDISFPLIGRYDFDYEHSRDWLRRRGVTWI